jgi:hypothetical protein
MTSAELERLLARVDELEELRRRTHRAASLAEEISHDEHVERAAPELCRALAERGQAVEAITRELEREWVEQGPLVSAWQRSVELLQQAQSAAAETGPFEAEVDAARGQVERARLATRDARERLLRERERVADLFLEAPFELELPEPPVEDARPEAARREALALLELVESATRRALAEQEEAAARLAEARAELERVGAPDELRRRVAALERELPARVEVPEGTPPSAAMRLARAGVDVGNAAAP